MMWCVILLVALAAGAAEREAYRPDDDSDETYQRNKMLATTLRTTRGEVVVEKFIETLMSSERYLKMVEIVLNKLTHLDSTFHERTNSMIKYLSEMLRVVKSPAADALEKSLREMVLDLGKLKDVVLQMDRRRPHLRGGSAYVVAAVAVEERRGPDMAVNKVCVVIMVATLAGVGGEKPWLLNRNDNGRTDNADKTLWKKEYEDELTDAMLSTRRKANVTRVPQSTLSDTEVVIEKLLETLTSNERYLKKIDSIDFRLNRLDIEVHEKSNSIMKFLTEILKFEKSSDRQRFWNKIDTDLEVIKTDLSSVKFTLPSDKLKAPAVDGADFQSDANVDSRLSFLETSVKSISSGVDSILSVINEVKTRQYSRSGTGGVTYKPESPYGDTMSLITEFRRSLMEQRNKKCDCKSVRVDRAERYPTDCHEIQLEGFNVSGIYKIKPEDMDPFYVLCDLTTAGGGWTVFQNRFDGTQDFYKSWWDYKHGFGNLAGEFWLGLDKLHYLTNQKLYEARVEVETQHGQDAFAGFSVFTVGPEHEGYRISTLGNYYGTAGDSLTYHAGQKFSTPDVDNDDWKDGSCASEHGGAWWYKECDKSNLNGKYPLPGDEHSRIQTMYWISFKGPNFPLVKTKMMIRPLPASKPTDYADRPRGLADRGKLERPPRQRPAAPYAA